MRIEPEISGASIVLVGNLNPTIFSPSWFARHGVISDEDSQNANVGIIHPQVAQFGVDAFQVVVETERFAISTTHAPLIRIHDVVVRVFDELLVHTPLRQVGINRQVHFKVKDQTVRDRVGYALAPPEAWGKWGERLRAGTAERHGGMMSLTMHERDLDDRPAGHVASTVEPSNQISGACGIFVQVNDHYDVAGIGKDSKAVIDVIKNRFEASISRADWIVEEIMALAEHEGRA